MASPAELSNRYIDAHNAHDLDALVALVDESVDFKRPDEPALTGQAAVRAQYAADWSTHGQAHVEVERLFACGSTVVVEIDVDAGPPSHQRYLGAVIHDWSADETLVRYRLYIGDTERLSAANWPGMGADAEHA